MIASTSLMFLFTAVALAACIATLLALRQNVHSGAGHCLTIAGMAALGAFMAGRVQQWEMFAVALLVTMAGQILAAGGPSPATAAQPEDERFRG